MATVTEVRVPDIGGATDVEVIEILVKVGDEITQDDSIVTLESDKASMEIPAPENGIVKEIKVNIGDKVAENSLILMLEQTADSSATGKPVQSEKTSKEKIETSEPVVKSESETTVSAKQSTVTSEVQTKEVRIPDIGDAANVDVIEVNIAPGDEVAVDDTLITLEGDKATMEIPAPFAGTIKELKIKVGAKVSKDDLILIMDAKVTTEVAAASDTVEVAAETTQVETTPAESTTPASLAPTTTGSIESSVITTSNNAVYAGPAVRRLANELGVDLSLVKGSGRKGRIVTQDVQRYVKNQLAQKSTAGPDVGLPQAPSVDFARYGEVEVKPLSKINKISGANLHRNWLLVPHVTQFEEADITEMEAFRKVNKATVEAKGAKLTPLVFIMKAIVAGLKACPKFNASLDQSGENLYMKKYFHIGVAVDTPNGLVVPVIRDVDQKSLTDLALELGAVSQKAREKGLSVAEMQGGCFTISSLGGIGGTAFTPIVNLPEVAILGVSKSSIKPVYQNNEFVPRLMLPLSLSYDHRVIDGAEAARFIVHVSNHLADVRRLLL